MNDRFKDLQNFLKPKMNAKSKNDDEDFWDDDDYKTIDSSDFFDPKEVSLHSSYKKYF